MTYPLMSLLAVAISFSVTAILGKLLIPWLTKLKFGQNIKDIGPTWHASKQGTPTMGGLMFIGGIILAVVVCIPVYRVFAQNSSQALISPTDMLTLWAGFIMGILHGVSGFLDDYISIVHKENTGLTVKQKFAMQWLTTIAYLATLFIADNGATVTFIPFVGETGTLVITQLGWRIVYYLVSLVMIVGFINAVNLTDGVDGLCSSVTFFVMISFMIMAGIRSLFEVGIFAAAIAGGCLGFLLYNFHPAKVFMGDTGSLFLGGMFCAVAYAADMPIMIPLVGVIYLCEAGSVMLQTTYYKLTHGKRIFKMTPIHHSFEMSGWSEKKIVVGFSLVTVIAGAVAVLLTVIGG